MSDIWVPFGYGAILISLNFKDLKNNYEPTRGLILLHAQYKGLFGRFSGLIREIVERHKTRLLLVRPLLNFDRPWISMDDRRSTKRDFQLASNTWRLDDDGVCTRDHRRRVLNGLRRISSCATWTIMTTWTSWAWSWTSPRNHWRNRDIAGP